MFPLQMKSQAKRKRCLDHTFLSIEGFIGVRLKQTGRQFADPTRLLSPLLRGAEGQQPGTVTPAISACVHMPASHLPDCPRQPWEAPGDPEQSHTSQTPSQSRKEDY